MDMFQKNQLASNHHPLKSVDRTLSNLSPLTSKEKELL
jgi:hypothetical protein